MKQFYLKWSRNLKRSLKNQLMPVVLITLLSSKVFSQVGTLSETPQVVSPEAAALGKFVEVPVSNYSGLPEIGIPIYDLKTKLSTVPISLSYHASGVKIKEFPCWVGANFALAAGGTITRVIRGEPDNFSDFPGFYKTNAELLGTPGYNRPDPRMMSGIASSYYANEKADLQFDIYYYNVMGHSGRFTFDNDGSVLMMDASDMKVEYGGGTFRMIDSNGTFYEFGMADYYMWQAYQTYENTWYLTEIWKSGLYGDIGENVIFNYKKYDNWKLYRSSYGAVSMIDRELYQDVFPPYGLVTNPSCQNSRHSYPDDLWVGETSILQSIKYKSDSIKFYHDTSRADVYKVRLDSIKVFQGASPMHTTRFSYSFTNSGSSDPRDKKMLLTSVQSNDQPAYTMGYYDNFNSKGMPGSYVLGSDMWGYYNGQEYDIYTPVNTPRNPDYRYAQLGALKTLTYPTGGNTEFTYEGNDFSYCQNVLDSVGPIYKAGGLRIKKIKFTSPVSSSSFEKTYEYRHGSKSSGVLETLFANKSSELRWGEGRAYIYTSSCGGMEWPEVCTFLKISSDNVIPLGNAQGGAIGYAEVTEKLGDGSKKVMQFTNGGFDPYTYYPLFDPLLDGFADGYNNDYLGDHLIQDRVTADYSSYRGKLKNVAWYNSGGQKLKEEVHRFVDLIGDWMPFSLQPKSTNIYLAPGRVDDYSYVGACGYPPHYGTNWVSYFHMQRNVVPIVDSLYTFIGADTIREVIKYDYNGFFRNVPSMVTKIGVDGGSTVTVNKYPYDYSGSATDAFALGVGNAAARNVISRPVESYVIKKDAGGGNARVTDAQLLQYNSLTAVPEKVYKLSNPAGLTDFSPSSITANPSTIDSRYQPVLKFYRYDGKENITEQGKEGEVKEVLVWGYSRRFVVARISSSTYATVIALVDTNVINNPSSDAVLRTELAKIRTGLASTNPQAKVTSYTYATLKGVTSMTDPKGDTTYYEYDSYGRLKRGKDPDDQIKENLWYHYQP